jgi:hypothetical protein
MKDFRSHGRFFHLCAQHSGFLLTVKLFFSWQMAICVSAEPVALKTTPKSAKPYPLAGDSMSAPLSTNA